MNPKVAKRRDFLIDLVFVMAIIGLVYVFFKYLLIVSFNKSGDMGLVKNSLHPLSIAAALSFS